VASDWTREREPPRGPDLERSSLRLREVEEIEHLSQTRGDRRASTTTEPPAAASIR
jgi:hypothetical protein